MSARILLAAALLLLLAGPARAAHIDLAGSDLGGGSVVETDLGPDTLAFDPAFVSSSAMTLHIVLDAGEGTAPLAWNALVDNLTGELWGAFSIRLAGATFTLIGSAKGNSAVASVVGGAADPTVVFGAPGEAAGLDLGAALGTGTDWLIDVSGVGAEGFAIVLQPFAVPEPGTAALVALGLAGLCVRRRPGER